MQIERRSKLKAELWAAPTFSVVREEEGPVRDTKKEWPAWPVTCGDARRAWSTNLKGKKCFRKEAAVGCASAAERRSRWYR